MEIFLVNGVKYTRKERKQISPSKSNAMKKMLPFMMMAGMMDGGWGIKELERPNVDIIEEYGKIQLKKSNLSSRQRQWVVNQFESKYQILK